MVKSTRRLFTVEGAGVFPFDMLRYDHCWPYTEAEDSPAVAQHPLEAGVQLRRVVLATDNPHAPTLGRWDSHCWRVVARFEARDPKEVPTPPRGVVPLTRR